MRILSFNTSTSNLYACLAEGSSIIVEKTIVCSPEDRQFSASLIIPTLSDLLLDAKWQKSDLKAIAVGIGPGSFTGIRVAVVTARTLCQALNLPLLGINEFECYAFREQFGDYPFAIAIDAGKNQYYCAHINQGYPSAVAVGDKKMNQAKWEMTYHYLSEEDSLSHFADFKGICKSVPLSSDQINPAITQALIADLWLKEAERLKQGLNEVFPYHIVKPLYIRNASITISPANKIKKS
jgi:tRNA threonylcarbamoyl adenosine modification protein YeaZ